MTVTLVVVWHQVRELPKTLLLGLVRAYRLILSPWLGTTCRFTPTCSAYALGALELHGAAAGTGLAVWRVLRCNPWCDGGHDPVPGRSGRADGPSIGRLLPGCNASFVSPPEPQRCGPSSLPSTPDRPS